MFKIILNLIFNLIFLNCDFKQAEHKKASRLYPHMQPPQNVFCSCKGSKLINYRLLSPCK